MRSLYVHIPFCRKACHYCAFHFSTNLSGTERVLRCIVREAELRGKVQGLNDPQALDTLYWGGGTPSILNEESMVFLLNGIASCFDLRQLKEFTLEANPEDVSPSALDRWYRLGITRISLGVQSVSDDFLGSMNRAHDAAQALEAMQFIQQNWQGNWTADLIYGYPQQGIQELSRDLEAILEFDPGHFSAYQLTQEPRTALHNKIQKGLLRLPDDDRVLELMEILYKKAGDHGYRAYEISNFARPGSEALHNSRYWSGDSYLGLGPSAHSYDGIQTRSWNVNHNIRYCQGVEEGRLDQTVEVLGRTEQLNEFLMIRLRLDEGLSWAMLEENFGREACSRVQKRLSSLSPAWFMEEGHTKPGSALRLSIWGRGMADYIASTLFDDPND
ncbi:MAG: radical SAM family heme chaperone HemW [Bacteroidota bacterium]